MAGGAALASPFLRSRPASLDEPRSTSVTPVLLTGTSDAVAAWQQSPNSQTDLNNPHNLPLPTTGRDPTSGAEASAPASLPPWAVKPSRLDDLIATQPVTPAAPAWSGDVSGTAAGSDSLPDFRPWREDGLASPQPSSLPGTQQLAEQRYSPWQDTPGLETSPARLGEAQPPESYANLWPDESLQVDPRALAEPPALLPQRPSQPLGLVRATLSQPPAAPSSPSSESNGESNGAPASTRQFVFQPGYRPAAEPSGDHTYPAR